MGLPQIDKLIKIIEPVAKAPLSKEIEFPLNITFKNFLERILRNLYSLKPLLTDDYEKTDQGISLVLRNLLTDFIVCGHIICNSKDIQHANKLAYSLMYSDIKKSESYLSFVQKSSLINTEIIDLKRNNTIKKIVEFYEENNLKTFPNTKEIVRSIIDVNTKLPLNWKEDIFNAYDLWIILSKYEHIGWFSFSITRDIDSTTVEGRTLEVIKLTTFLCGNLCEYLDNNFDLTDIWNLYEECEN